MKTLTTESPILCVVRVLSEAIFFLGQMLSKSCQPNFVSWGNIPGTFSGEHVYTCRWACARSQLSMCMLATSCAHFQLSMCMIQMYTSACASSQLSMCTLPGVHVHAPRCVCACSKLSMCTFAVEHVHTLS